jgi:hypothetical protein
MPVRALRSSLALAVIAIILSEAVLLSRGIALSRHSQNGYNPFRPTSLEAKSAEWAFNL